MYPHYPQPQTIQRGNPPVMFNIPLNPIVQPWFGYIITDIITNLTTKANANQLRNLAYNVYATNNWNNQAFSELCQVTAGQIAKQMQYNNNYEAVYLGVVDAVCTAALGVVYCASLSSGNPVQLQPHQANEAMQLESRYYFLANEVGLNLQGAVPAQPTMGNMYMNAGYPSTAASTGFGTIAISGSSGLVSNQTQTAAWNNPTTNNSTGWKRVAPEPAVIEAQTNDGQVVEVIDTKKETTPLKDGRWREVKPDEALWGPTAQQRYPMVYDPRKQTRRFYVDKDGNTLEEFEDVDYNEHAITAPFTVAEYNRIAAQMRAQFDTEITDEEIKSRIVRVIPARDEYKKIVIGETIADASSTKQALDWAQYQDVIVKAIAEKNNQEKPEVVISFARVFNNLIGKAALEKEFLDKVAATRSWSDAHDLLTRHAELAVEGIWTYVEEYLTEELRTVLNVRLGIEAIQFDSFYEDYHALVDLVKEQYGDLYYGGLTTSRRYEAFKHFITLSKEELTKPSVKSIIQPWTMDDLPEESNNVLITHQCYALIEESSLDLPFELKRGKWAGLTYEGSGRLRTLADLMFEETKDLREGSLELLIVTRNRRVYKLHKALVDDSLVLIQRVR